jgi:exosortase
MGQSMASVGARRRHARPAAGWDKLWNSREALLAAGALLLIVTAWTYWPTLVQLYKDWQRNEDYSAGQLVPLVAIFLIWWERKALATYKLTPCWWGGVLLLLLAQAGRAYGLLFMFESAERYSLVLTIAALVLMVAGRQVFRRLSWILLFLFLMVPLPGRVHNLISGPLQSLATTGSVLLLEVIGVRVSQQGNVVTLNQTIPLAVEEACSGLRMLTAFIIVAAFIAYMVKRPRWQKGLLVLSSIAVGVICNIVRILATALIMVFISVELGGKFFHDFAGLVMMPVAVVIIFAEIGLLDLLIVPDAPASGQVIVAAKSPAGTGTKHKRHARTSKPYAPQGKNPIH